MKAIVDGASTLNTSTRKKEKHGNTLEKLKTYRSNIAKAEPVGVSYSKPLCSGLIYSIISRLTDVSKRIVKLTDNVVLLELFFLFKTCYKSKQW